MGAVSYATRCTAKAKGSKLHYVIYVLSAVGYVMRVQVPATCCLVCCWGPCNWNTWSRQLQVMRWLDFRCWFGSRVVHSLVSCPLLLKALFAVSWQRIGCVLTAYWTGAKFATNEIPGMTHTLRYSVSGWPTGSNILSLGGPNYWKIQYNRYWLQPFAKNLIAYRVRIEALIMRIELFSILVSSNCVSSQT